MTRRRQAKGPTEVELDLGRYELRRSGRRIKLERKPMELLILLVGRRDQLVSRNEIVTTLWPSDFFIDAEANVNNITRKLRTALKDRAEKPRFLETVVGKGYRFVGPVRVISPRFSQFNAGTLQSGGHAAPSSSMAVLVPVADGDFMEGAAICLGLADALVARLANLQGVDVLPTSAVLKLPPEASPAEISASLGVRFVVHGRLRMSKGQVRLALEMFDTHLQGSCFTHKFDVDVNRVFEAGEGIAKQIASTLHRPLRSPPVQANARFSRDPLAYAEFMQGYRLSSSGDPTVMESAIQHLVNAVARDPNFALAHATLSQACASRHFDFDPAGVWLDKAEFHCQRALESSPVLAEGHVAKAFLLWGPSKNFQHLEAIAELRRALALQKNLPRAYNRLGTILAHVGLLDRAREMYERGRPFHPKRQLSHSIVQVYVWGGEYDLALEETERWQAENPTHMYPLYFGIQAALLSKNWELADVLLSTAGQRLGDEPLIASLQGLFCALTGKETKGLDYVTRACANPKSFGHAHHTYYQIANTLAVLGRRAAAFEWLDRSVSTGFACWPFFQRDPYLENVRALPEFEVLVSSLQAKYPDHLGLL